MSFLKRLVAVYHSMRCPKHLPGPGFPWNRCQYGCPWCDYIQRWISIPLCSSPYR